jgi:fumagillin biosynthesis dioxygenase
VSAAGAPSLRVVTDQLEEVGYAIFPGVPSDQESDALIQTLWDSSAEAERRSLPSYVPSLDPNPSNVRVFNLVDLDPVFGDLLAHPTATEIVASYLGEDYVISNFSANIARPGSRPRAFHSDQASSPRALDIALVDERDLVSL